MEEKRNKRKLLAVGLLVFSLVLITVGTTFAFFQYSREGTTPNKVQTGTLTFIYDEMQEKDGNSISLTNAFPTTDDKGTRQDDYFEFQVRATTQGAPIYYEVYLTKEDSSTLPEKVIDTYLTEVTNQEGLGTEKDLTLTWENAWTKDNHVTQYQYLYNSHVPVVEEEQGKSLYQEKIEDGEASYLKTFRLRMWIDENANDVNAKGEWIYNNKQFSVKVNVYASNEELPDPTPVGVMKNWVYNIDDDSDPFEGGLPSEDFHTEEYMTSISKISFINKIEEPENVEESWDISAKNDESVMAYLIPSTTEGEMCPDFSSEEEDATIPCKNVIIASNGETYGNPNSSFTFGYFVLLKDIDFTNYNASLIEDATYMFTACSSLTKPDLNSWDTSSMKNLSNMFLMCASLNELNLNNWDTSNVVDMSYMFGVCSQLTSLDLNNWDTSNVVDMSYMFNVCSQLTSLDLNNWDTSNVTNMSGMFMRCISLDSIDLSKLITSNVTDMSGMFAYCSTLASLDINTWDTSNVTNMIGMFYSMSSLTNLDLSNWDTSNVISMEEMFIEMSSLTELDISSFEFKEGTGYEGMFAADYIYSGSDDVYTNNETLETIYVKDDIAKQFIKEHATTMGLDSTRVDSIVQVKQ